MMCRSGVGRCARGACGAVGEAGGAARKSLGRRRNRAGTSRFDDVGAPRRSPERNGSSRFETKQRETLPAANRRNDLEPVAREHSRVRIAALGDDLAVPLDGNAFALEAERTNQRRNVGGWRFNDARRAVDGDFHVDLISSYDTYLRNT